MKKEERKKDIVEHSEKDDSDSSPPPLELGAAPPLDVEIQPQLLDAQEELTGGSTSYSIDVDSSGTSAAENCDTSDHGSTQLPPVRDKSRLVREIEKGYKSKAEPKIQKVPTILRRDNGCYDPMIVAIGPYHHGNAKLKQMEDFKIQLTRRYVKRSGKSAQKLYQKMEKKMIDAKKYYARDVANSFTNEDFANMMFLDSCFVIQFIDSYVNLKRKDIRTKYIEKVYIIRDIMLLENQLPYKILAKLMSLSERFKGGKGKKMIDNFIKVIMNVSRTKEEAHERRKGSSEGKKKPIHLLELVQARFVDDKEIKDGASKDPSPNWCLYRTVKELKSVGIHFQPSKSCRFSEITFKSMYFYGRLKLPQITIHDGTKSLLLNLATFEACADTSSNFGVSSYVYFMDTLIDAAEDVKELRSKGIILNLLGSDEQVADLFNGINENLVTNFQIFGNVRKSLDKFYSSRRRLWLTECLHDHFRSPWAIIAFLAATVLLCLTIAQTVFSTIQL